MKKKITFVGVNLYNSSYIPWFASLWIDRGKKQRCYRYSGPHQRYRMQRIMAFQAAYLKRLATPLSDDSD